MICEITNRLVKMMLWTMSYGEEKRLYTPDTEVSIKDFIAIIILCPLMLLFVTWWYVPGVWLYQHIICEKIGNLLNTKRFKCKKVIK